MAKVTITIEDKDGLVDLRADLHGEQFSTASHAHRTANMILNFLDKVQEPVPEPANEVVQLPPKAIYTPIQRAIQVVH